MNIVIVKHESCGQKFLFQAPEAEHLKAGDLVKVKTKKGFTLATCLCDSFIVGNESPEFNAICMAFNAYTPLAPVVGKYNYRDFCTNDAKENETSDTSNGEEEEHDKVCLDEVPVYSKIIVE